MSGNRAFALAKLTFRVPKGGGAILGWSRGANVAKTYIRRSVEGGCLLNSALDLKFQSLLKSALYGHVIVILTIPILIISPHSIHSSSSKISTTLSSSFHPLIHPSSMAFSSLSHHRHVVPEPRLYILLWVAGGSCTFNGHCNRTRGSP